MSASHAMKLKPWIVPNFVQFEMPPGKREDGLKSLPGMHVSELTHAELSDLAEEWLMELYLKAGKVRNFTFTPPKP